MMLLISYGMFVGILLFLGMRAWYLDEQKKREQVMLEALHTSRYLETSLGQRLDEMDAYRHDLAEVLQSLDIELVRQADSDSAQDTV